MRIADVVDARQFQSRAIRGTIPSREEAKSPSPTERVIARHVNWHFQPKADVVLPAGQSVASLTRAAVAAGFQATGYRVLQPGDAGYEQATRVDLRIVDFWAWLTPEKSWMTVEYNHRATVEMRAQLADLPDGPHLLQTRVSRRSYSPELYQEVTEDGLQALTKATHNALSAAPSTPRTP